MASEEIADRPPVLPRVATGDPSAVRECLCRYRRLVFSLAQRSLGHVADAEDATQDIFIDLWRNAGRFDPTQASEPTFVAMIARRRLIDRHRRAARRPAPAALDIDYPQPDPRPTEFELADEVRLARQALAELRDDQRTVLLLAIDRGLSHEEIAAHTALPVGTVKTHIRRGLIRIRERLDVVPAGGAR